MMSGAFVLCKTREALPEAFVKHAGPDEGYLVNLVGPTLARDHGKVHVLLRLGTGLIRRTSCQIRSGFGPAQRPRTTFRPVAIRKYVCTVQYCEL